MYLLFISVLSNMDIDQKRRTVVAELFALNALKEEDFYFEQVLESLNIECYKSYGWVWKDMGNIFI